MPDRAFSNPYLASLYDVFDADRSDLDHYVAIVSELGAERVVDIGCGTGELALRLAGAGLHVTAIDPAAAMLDVARAKPGAERVTWIHGDATLLESGQTDVATMTGNVAQVFLGDDDWAQTLGAIRRALRPEGHLVSETRDPARRAWESWTPEALQQRVHVPGLGVVESVGAVTSVSLPFVSFTYTYTFHADGTVLTSDSTLRFRERSEIEGSLDAAGFEVVDVRDAPDRPGLEFVFIARSLLSPLDM